MSNSPQIDAAAKVSTMPEFSAVESPLILAICQAYESAKTVQPDEYTVVPKEITLEMQHAYFDVINKNMERVSTDPRFGRYDSNKEAYRAMIAAAPAVSVPMREYGCHEWKHTPAIKTTPVKCLLCADEATVIIYAADGCTCSPNKFQPRCEQHLMRLRDTGEEFEILEDFRIPTPSGNSSSLYIRLGCGHGWVVNSSPVYHGIFAISPVLQTLPIAFAKITQVHN